MNYQPWVSVEPSGLMPMRTAPAVTPREARLRYLGVRDEAPEPRSPLATARVIVTLVAAAVAGFHGYKRNSGSKGWAAAWALGGALCPSVTLTFVFSQGFAKPAKG